MTIREFTQEALHNLKGKPVKDKISHILTYYWIPIVGCIIAIVLLATVISTAVNRKETVLMGYCVNASVQQEASEQLLKNFSLYAQLTEKQTVTILGNLSTSSSSLPDTLQALTVHSAAQDVDFIASSLDGCLTFLQYGYYWDLSQLPQEQQALLHPYFLYVERASLQQQEPDSDHEPAVPVFAEKEALKDPVAVALRLPAGCRLSKSYRFTGNGEAYVLLLPNSVRKDMLYSFLEYILN